MDIRKKVSPLRQFLTDPDRPALALLDLGLLAIWIIGAWLQAIIVLVRTFFRVGVRTGKRLTLGVHNTHREVKRSIVETRHATSRALEHSVERSQKAVTTVASTTTNALSSAVLFFIKIVSAPFRYTFRAITTVVYAIKTLLKALAIVIGYGAYEMSEQIKASGRDLRSSVHHSAKKTAHIIRHPSAVIQPPPGWRTAIVGFVAVALVFSLPFPAVYGLQKAKRIEKEAMGRALEGLDAFYAAYDAMMRQDTDEAQRSFALAYSKFEEAGTVSKYMNPALFAMAKSIPVEGKKIDSAEKMLMGGKELAIAGQSMARIAGQLMSEDALHGNILDIHKNISPDLELATTHVDNATKLITPEVVSSLPEQYRDDIASAQGKLEALNNSLQDLSLLSQAIGPIMGDNIPRRYLFVFQNNAELRPTGGFMGSYALVDVSGGEIKKVSVPGGGPYDLKGSLMEKIIAPQPLHLINTAWQFQDANWFADFPTSAQKIEWFFEKSGQSSVDGVVAINASIMEELLELTGPVEMNDYGKTINSDNVLKEMQRSVDLEYDRKKNKPKKFIADLLPRILDRIGSGDRNDKVALMTILAKAGIEKDIQVYLKDQSAQLAVESFGLDGAIRNSSKDYLMVVDTNIGGGKSDAVINSDMNQSVKISDDGSIIETITLNKSHRGILGDPFTGRTHIDFVRFYVPVGSTILSATGFNAPKREKFKNPLEDYRLDTDLSRIQGDVYWNDNGMFVNSEFGKTVFSNWIQLAPGEMSSVTISYKLPFTVEDLRKNGGYSLFLQKQSGVKNRTYSFNIEPSGNVEIIPTYPSGLTSTNGTSWQYNKDNLSTDQIISFQIK